MPYPLGSPRYFPKDDDNVRRFPDLLRRADGNNDKITSAYWNLEYGMDLAGARPPYSGASQLHGRKVTSYELDVACSKQGPQTEDYQKYISILDKSEHYV